MVDFFPYGSDERQYCSPGFNLPVGSLMRSMYGTYPEYHTSLDDRTFISFEAIQQTIDVYEQVAKTLELNRIYVNLSPWGEPQLGKRGLFNIGDIGYTTRDILWLLNLSDGSDTDLLDISRRSGVKLETLSLAAERCVEAGLLVPR